MKGCVLRLSIVLDTVQKYVAFAFGLIITEYYHSPLLFLYADNCTPPPACSYIGFLLSSASGGMERHALPATFA